MFKKKNGEYVISAEKQAYLGWLLGEDPELF